MNPHYPPPSGQPPTPPQGAPGWGPPPPHGQLGPPGAWPPGQPGTQPTGQGPWPTHHAGPPAPRPKSRLPLLLGVGALALVLIVVALYAVFARPGSPTTTGPGESPGVDGGTVAFEGDRIRFEVPTSWEHDAQANVKTTMPDFYVHDTEVWRGWDPATKEEPRELLSYQYYGQQPAPRTESVEEARLDRVLDTGVEQYRGLNEARLQSLLQTSAHGCFSGARFTAQPERFNAPGLRGLSFGFECLGGKSTQLKLEGRFVMLIDAYGDRHQLVLTSDRANFDARRAAFDAIFASIRTP